jgi:hypothetical protein
MTVALIAITVCSLAFAAYVYFTHIKDAIIKGRVHWHEFTVDGIWEHETKQQHLNK